MSRIRWKGARRIAAARRRGQSLPLIGLMIVVLVAMVGLSVDVGNTFSEERESVAAANAASLAGMNAYLARTGSTTNQTIYNAIINSLSANGVEVVPPGTNSEDERLELEAYYLDAQGKLISGAASITNNSNPVPNNVAFIQVNLKGRVSTYFARVVGRPDLPISATSHAGVCPAGNGIFPIGINVKWIDGDRFRSQDVEAPLGTPDNNWRVISSGPYRGRTAMRLDAQDGPGPGGFSWLRWRDGVPGANSAEALEAALSPEGSLAYGFDEAPWPNSDKPASYPEKPGQLNVGDWVWGTTGYNQRVDPEIEYHIDAGTRLVLPIYDTAFGNGSNARYQVVDLGLFVMLEMGQQSGEKYFDMIYLGSAVRQQTACSYTGAPQPGETFVLFGNVSLWPEYQYIPTERKPIQYVVVLDVSGSMSANFAGQCDRGPGRPPNGQTFWQCANGPDGAPAVQVTGTGPTYYWNNVNERRITVAKRAIEALVRSTNMDGNGSQRDTTRPVDQMALVWFTQTVQRTGTGNFRTFSSNPDQIIRNINDAGAYNGDRYRTSGGTNGAAGLYRAALAFDSAPKTVTELGKTWEYKRVVIFITDGVSNQFLNTSASNLHGGSSDINTYPIGHVCRVSNVVEIASCQVTGDGVRGGGMYRGMDRPITQAGNVSKQNLQANNVEVFAISLSNIPDTGLKDSIASFPSYYFSADTLTFDANGKTNVDKIMEAINTKVESGLCVARSDALDGGEPWRSTIPPDHFVPVAGLVYPTVGEVILEDPSNGTRINIPITADSNGTLTYRKEDVPRGTYQLTPYLFYRHPLDPPSAGPRRYSLIAVGDEVRTSIPVEVGPQSNQTGSFNQVIQQDLQLRLFGDVCATTNP